MLKSKKKSTKIDKHSFKSMRIFKFIHIDKKAVGFMNAFVLGMER